MIKPKQPEKISVDDGTKFLGALKAQCTERGIFLIQYVQWEKVGRKYTLLRKEIYAFWKI